MQAHRVRIDSLYTLVVKAVASDPGRAFLGSAAQCFRCFVRGNGGCVCFSFGTKSFSSFGWLHHGDLDRERHVACIAPAVVRSTCPFRGETTKSPLRRAGLQHLLHPRLCSSLYQLAAVRVASRVDRVVTRVDLATARRQLDRRCLKRNDSNLRKVDLHDVLQRQEIEMVVSTRPCRRRCWLRSCFHRSSRSIASRTA